MEDTFTIIKNLIVELLDLDPNEIHLTSKLYEDLNFDSLDKVKLIMNIEKEFSISIGDEELDNSLTVQNLVNVIDKTN